MFLVDSKCDATAHSCSEPVDSTLMFEEHTDTEAGSIAKG